MIAELEGLSEKQATIETGIEEVKTSRTEETSMIMKEILKGPKVQFTFGDDKETLAFEEEIKKAINQCIEGLKKQLIAKLRPVLNNLYEKQFKTNLIRCGRKGYKRRIRDAPCIH